MGVEGETEMKRDEHHTHTLTVKKEDEPQRRVHTSHGIAKTSQSKSNHAL